MTVNEKVENLTEKINALAYEDLDTQVAVLKDVLRETLELIRVMAHEE